MRSSTTTRKGSAGQWSVAFLAILATAILVFWIISNRPAPPHYDDLRISTIETPSPRPRGPRLVVETPSARKARGLESPSFSLEPGEQLAPGLPISDRTTYMVVPIRIDAPLEASVYVEFADMDVEVVHNETVLGQGRSADGESSITTERLPFPVGTFNFEVRFTITGPAPRCAVSWILDPSQGPVAIPSAG